MLGAFLLFAIVTPAVSADPVTIGPAVESWERQFNAALEAEGRGDLAAAGRALESVIKAAEAVSSDDPRPLVIGPNKLAALALAKNDLRGAERLYERALGLVDKWFGADQLAVATTLTGPAGVLHAQAKYRDAAGKGARTQSRDLTDMLMALAVLGVTTGQLRQTERLYKRIIAIQEAALGPEHCDFGKTLQTYSAAPPVPLTRPLGSGYKLVLPPRPLEAAPLAATPGGCFHFGG